MKKHYLHPFFNPSSIALVGASDRPRSLGRQLMDNLNQSGFSGQVIPVHPNYKEVANTPCLKQLSDIEHTVDLVVLACPHHTIESYLRICAELDLKSVMILSSMVTLGEEDKNQLFNTITCVAKETGLRVMGPSGFGLIGGHTGLHLTGHRVEVHPGKLALVSQSGAICSAILDWAVNNGVGFSQVVSLELMVGISFGEVLDYLALDWRTENVLFYVEGVHDARTFMSGLRGAARSKPILTLKSGHFSEDRSTILAHTKALLGSDQVFGAALDRAGVVRAQSINDLFLAARAFSIYQKLHGSRIGIIANGFGPALIATDSARAFSLKLADLSEETKDQLSNVLLRRLEPSNPLCLPADADAQPYRRSYELMCQDAQVDLVLVILSPWVDSDVDRMTQDIIEVYQQQKKPLMACWMGDSSVHQAKHRLQQAGIPVFSTPENAVRAIHYLVQYQRNHQLLLQTPGPLGDTRKPDLEGAKLIIEGVLSEQRRVLNQMEAKALLRAFHIPVTKDIRAQSPNEALVAAESIGFPVAMKIDSSDVYHKSDLGGVKLNVDTAAAVRPVYNQLIENLRNHNPNANLNGVLVEPMVSGDESRELLLAIIRDPVFGPAMVFGAGGTMVEVLQDRAIALPPLNAFLIDDLIEKTRVSGVLGPFRHMRAVNRAALHQVCMRLSEMACELPWIQSLEINPLIIDHEQLFAVDVHVEVATLEETRLVNYQHMAIHPFPSHLQTTWQLKDGTDIVIRPIRPEDAQIELAFIDGLSNQSRYYRFMHNLKRVSPEMLSRFTQIDYHRELALIASVQVEGEEREIGVCRFILNPDGDSCEFAIVVGDEWQGTGIGYRLMELLIEAAKQKGIKRMEGDVLKENRPMQRLARNLGFKVMDNPEDIELVLVVKELN